MAKKGGLTMIKDLNGRQSRPVTIWDIRELTLNPGIPTDPLKGRASSGVTPIKSQTVKMAVWERDGIISYQHNTNSAKRRIPVNGAKLRTQNKAAYAAYICLKSGVKKEFPVNLSEVL